MIYPNGELDPGPREIPRDTAARQAWVRRHTRPRPLALTPSIRIYALDLVVAPGPAPRQPFAPGGVPLWGLAWPGGEALARHLSEFPELVRGRSVLDIGTGCGVCALAAARAGAASVRGVDVDSFAVSAAGLNAQLNALDIEFECTDPLAAAAPDVDVILAADLWYERWLGLKVTPWLRAACAAGTRVLAGDPGRAWRPRCGLSVLARYPLTTSPQLERATLTTVEVFELRAVAGQTGE